MARKTPTVLLLVLVLVFATVAYYLFYSKDGFQNIGTSYRCPYGMTCPEGQFCEENTCRPIYPPVTNQFM